MGGEHQLTGDQRFPHAFPTHRVIPELIRRYGYCIAVVSRVAPERVLTIAVYVHAHAVVVTPELHHLYSLRIPQYTHRGWLPSTGPRNA
jgi:hypothetical protein